MSEIAAASNSPVLIADIVYMIDKRLSDHGKYWRHVYKALVLLEYCVVCGSENMVRYANDKIYLIRTLKEFVHYDQYGREQGAGIRQKAAELLDLLTNDAALAEARANKTLPTWANRENNVPQITYPGYASPHGSNQNAELPVRGSAEDLELQRALEESKRTAAEDDQRRRQRAKSMEAYNSIPEDHDTRREYYYFDRQEERARTKAKAHSYDPLPASPNSRQRGLIFSERKALMPPPAENPFLDSAKEPEANPFEEEEDVMESMTKIVSRSADNPFQDDNQLEPNYPESEYNIPMPKARTRSRTVDELTVGAKPVLPANLTPQFSSTRPNPRPDPTYRPG
jgi:hypothetical protein